LATGRTCGPGCDGHRHRPVDQAPRTSEPDDEFAQLASEFDTIDELRDNLRDQVSQFKRAQQAEQIREATLDTLLEQVEVPVPEAVVQAQYDSAIHGALHGLKPRRRQTRRGARRAGQDARGVRGRDTQRRREGRPAAAVADTLAEPVGGPGRTGRPDRATVATSRQYGIEPQQLFGYLQENKQLPAMFADVRRGLAIGAVVSAAGPSKTPRNTIDTSEFFPPRGQAMSRGGR